MIEGRTAIHVGGRSQLCVCACVGLRQRGSAYDDDDDDDASRLPLLLPAWPCGLLRTEVSAAAGDCN